MLYEWNYTLNNSDIYQYFYYFYALINFEDHPKWLNFLKNH